MWVPITRVLPRPDDGVEAFSPGKSRRVVAQAANLLSATRFVLTAGWIAAFLTGHRRPHVFGPIALVGATSDFVDGHVARRMRRADEFGR